MNASTQAMTTQYPEFDLDVSIVESGPVVPDLMRNTDDNCGSPEDSAGVTCIEG
jgi:FxLD family lantipeptide